MRRGVTGNRTVPSRSYITRPKAGRGEAGRWPTFIFHVFPGATLRSAPGFVECGRWPMASLASLAWWLGGLERIANGDAPVQPVSG